MKKLIARHLCEHCDSPIEQRFDALPADELAAPCPQCKSVQALEFNKSSRDSEMLENCPKCKGIEFFEQKDFNRNLGMAIVVLGALGMLVMIALGHEAPTAYLFLGGAVVVDWLLYQLLPNVTVCYKCDSVFKAIKFSAKTGEFSLETHDGYRYWDKGESIGKST